MRELCLVVSLSLVAAVMAFGQSPTKPRTHVTRVADGFDFPVAKPDGRGYKVYRGFIPGKHMGADMNAVKGRTGDPIYSVAHGLVLMARDARGGWGNLVIVRHAYYANGRFNYVDSAYAHLERITVREGQQVVRGQQVGTLGSGGGRYAPHLHFEMRKNLNIGHDQRGHGKTFAHYFDPLDFIRRNRTLRRPVATAQVPVFTFPLPSKPGTAKVSAKKPTTKLTPQPTPRPTPRAFHPQR